MSHSIELRDEAKKYKLSQAKVTRVCREILDALGWKNAALDIWLVTDRKMAALNWKFLKHRGTTDIISFSQLEGRKLLKGLSPWGTVPLGDLIISLDTTARQAKAYGNDFWYEFCFYICHGILHLMGWDDQTPSEAQKMEKKQMAILKKIRLVNSTQFGVRSK